MAAPTTQEMTGVIEQDAPRREGEGIVLTPSAAEKLGELMEQKGVRDTHALRVFIRGGGCSGFQYGMTFDSSPRPVDSVFEEHGLRVIVDPQSLQYMAGSSIDYVDDPAGGGFHIENPNSAAACSGGGCSGCR
jgi:iron-sulfur cluster assembly accessory protein